MRVAGTAGRILTAPACPHTASLPLAGRGWRVAADVAEALHFLHSRSVIHSDLKAA